MKRFYVVLITCAALALMACNPGTAMGSAIR